MQTKKQLITLGLDGELALKSPDGSTQKLPTLIKQASASFVYLVIDCSGSMAGRKIEQAKEGALDFAASALSDGYAVGLISFGSNTKHLCSPMTNLEEIAISVNRLRPEGGTNLTPAIEEVIRQLSDNVNALRAMVIVTDGLTTNPTLAIKAADKAKSLGISILTIGTDDADFAFLSQLASDTKLAKKVSSDYLEEAISDAAKMLPKRN